MNKFSPHPFLKALIPIADGIAETIGENCEVAIHDFSHPRHSIFHIVHGEITGRKAGDSLGQSFIPFLELAEKGHDSLINYGFYENGHSLKCTKVFIRDEKNTIIGCLCINIAIESQLESLKLMEASCKTHPLESYTHEAPFPLSNENAIDEMVRNIILNSYDDFQKNGKMNASAKKEFVLFLNDQGVFNVKGTVDIVAGLLNVSKYTVYRYTNISNETA